MRFTLSSLKEFIETSASVDEICEMLTNIGLEVESIIKKGQELKNFTVAKITSCQDHPDSSKLKICKVLVEENQPELQIVCGAKNARSNIKVAYAKIGSVIPSNQMVIKNSKIAGIESQGMLCSAKELMINDDDEGIIEVDQSVLIGTKLSDLYHSLSEEIIEVYITPNRGDCLGLIGIARDLSATGIGKFKAPKINNIVDDFESKLNIKNLANQNCDYALFKEISGIENKISPQWLIDKVNSFGIASVSAIVDIMNLVTHLTSQPLHAYDLNKIDGDVIIRLSNNNENFTSLKNQNYLLDDNSLVISDQKKILSLAGIIGSDNSACEINTNHILIESASFDADIIARTGRKLNILTESRYRFERISDANNCKLAIDLATQLIKEICSNSSFASSKIIKIGNIKPSRKIDFDFSLIKKLIGIDIDQKIAMQILSNLGFFCNENEISIPSFRNDIKCSQDIIEEIVRIHGYHNIVKIPIVNKKYSTLTKNIKSNNNNLTTIEYNNSVNLNYYCTKIRNKLANRSISEAINWSFVDSKLIKLFGDENPSLFLKNPVSLEMNYLRPSLAIGLLKSCKINQLRNFNDLSFFEIGNIFIDKNKQQLCIAGIRVGKNKQLDHYQDSRDFDVFDVKADMISCLEALGLKITNLEFNSTDPLKYFHPHRFSSIKFGKKTLANFGEIHPSINNAFDIKNRINYFEIFIDDQMIAKKSNTSKAYLISDFPIVERDFAFVVDKDLPVNQLIKSIANSDKNLINEVSIFDIFSSSNLPENKKSVALRVKIQSNSKTLTTNEIDQLSQKIIEDLALQFQAVIRN